MLHSFYLKNFYSFYGESGIDLDGDKNNFSDIRFIKTAFNKVTSKSAVIFGANASGKTTFLKGLSFLSWFIRFSWTQLSATDLIPINQFLFAENNDDTIEFKLSSENAGKLYRYELTIKDGVVSSESLMIRTQGAIRRRRMFVRQSDNITLYEGHDFSRSDIPPTTRKNFSLISYALHAGFHFFDDFLESFNCISNVTSIGTVWINPLPIDRLYKDSVLRENVSNKLKNLDTGINNIIVKKEDNDNPLIKSYQELSLKLARIINIDKMPSSENIAIYNVTTEHTISDKTYSLPLQSESNGSQQLLDVLTLIYSVLEKGEILVYDELEHGIHPNILPELLNLFYSEETNPHHAQIICTCHSADLLNFLCKESVFITEKDQSQRSSIYSLTEIDGVRNDDNFMRKYLSGVYGGVPSL